MRSASTLARSEEIQGDLIGSSLKAEASLFFENADGEWQIIEHLNENKGIDWSESGQRYDYANVPLIPSVATIDFEVLNPGGIYSPGSGSDLDNVLDINTRVKLKAGYRLNELGDETSEAMSLIDGLYGYTFYTGNTLGYIQPDSENTDGNADIYFTDLFNTYYDEETYDDSSYTPAGYFVSTHPFSKQGLNSVTKFSVTANNTNGTIYYRSFNDRTTFEANNTTSASWTNAGATVNGTTEITVTGGSEDKYFQVAVVWDGIAWEDDIQLTDLTIYYQSYIEWIYESIYYLDSPEYTDPPAPEFPAIICSGRDAFKKAVETDVNPKDLSGGYSVDEVVKQICDQIGLLYTTDSIADLSAFGDRNLANGFEDPVKATEVFEKLMQICTQQGQTRYVMYTRFDDDSNDNILYIQPRPTIFDEFAAFSKNYLTTVGSKRKNYDRLMKRMTVVSSNGVADAEELLDSDTFTTTGTKTLSWSGNAEYKRYTVEIDGNATVTQVASSVTPTQIQFSITSGGGIFSVDINVYGNKWQSGAPTYEGESISYDNMVANAGQTRRIENKLLISSTEARKIAEAFIEDYGTPAYQAGGLTYPYLYLLSDINDGALIISPIVFINTIYLINNINHHWDRSDSPGDKSTFTLVDSGFELEDLVDLLWDGGLDWDSGLIWDLSFALSETEDTTDYDYLLPVEFS